MSTEDFKYRTSLASVSMDDDELAAAISNKIAAAERRMMNNFNEALFNGSIEPLTPEELKKYERDRRIQKLIAPYWWIRRRVVGVWNVLIYGESDPERGYDDDY